MTSAYIFRLYLRCFHGRPEAAGASAHAHESPWVMVLPMALLGVGAVCVGLVGSPATHFQLFHLLGVNDVHEGIDVPILFWSTAAAMLGFGLAWTIGLKRRQVMPRPLRPFGQWCYQLAVNKYYLDELYAWAIVRPLFAMSRFFAFFDQDVVDAAVNETGRTWRGIATLKAWIDQHVVDRGVNGLATVTRALGQRGRRLQTGMIQQYLFAVVIATVLCSVLAQR